MAGTAIPAQAAETTIPAKIARVFFQPHFTSLIFFSLLLNLSNVKCYRKPLYCFVQHFT
jgi:hypothetical protein